MHHMQNNKFKPTSSAGGFLTPLSHRPSACIARRAGSGRVWPCTGRVACLDCGNRTRTASPPQLRIVSHHTSMVRPWPDRPRAAMPRTPGAGRAAGPLFAPRSVGRSVPAYPRLGRQAAARPCRGWAGRWQHGPAAAGQAGGSTALPRLGRPAAARSCRGWAGRWQHGPAAAGQAGGSTFLPRLGRPAAARPCRGFPARFSTGGRRPAESCQIHVRVMLECPSHVRVMSESGRH
jgi:hypothetical protein